MSWDYHFTEKARKELKKLGASPAQIILKYLDEQVCGSDDPRRFGKPLRGDLGEYWRYRVQDYRILCQIIDEELIVLVVKVGHRKEVYD